jgi:HEAT repeat protein
MRRCFVYCVVLVAAATAIRSAEPDREVEDAEKFLQDDKIKTDGESLIAFFKERAGRKAPDPETIKQLVKQLGDDDFEQREKAEEKLSGMGRAAKELLSEAAKSRDPEVRYRAERCLSKLEEGREMLRVAYAAKVIAARKPKGAAEALLTYVPSAMDQMAEEAVFAALVKVGVADGKPLPEVVKALEDKEPLRRAAAGLVLAPIKDERAKVVKLLDDSDPRVRYYAASALVPLGEKKAVETLLPLLTDGTMTTARMAEDMLFRLAPTQKLPEATLSDSSEASRKKARVAWEKWWKDNEPKIDLAKLNLEDAVLGFTVIAEYSDSGNGAGRVWECGPDGKERWEIKDVASPMDVQVLPGGRVLIAEAGRGVTERDKTGKVLWEVKVEGQTTSCQRLANGNTVAFTYNAVFEFDRDGKQVFRHDHQGACYGGSKLRNGNYVYMLNSGQITEINPEGKEVRSIKPDTPDVSGCGYWVSVEGLPNGNYFVTLGSSGRVAEIDQAGKVVWSCKTDQTTGATRLRNGNALAVNTESRAVVEYDRDGKEVWRAKTVGRPFRVRRY